jgi:hypothetical protein
MIRRFYTATHCGSIDAKPPYLRLQAPGDFYNWRIPITWRHWWLGLPVVTPVVYRTYQFIVPGGMIMRGWPLRMEQQGVEPVASTVQI